MLEQGGFGRVPVGIGKIQALHRVNQLLGSRLSLLHEVRDVEHGVGWLNNKVVSSLRPKTPVKACRVACNCMQGSTDLLN